MAFLFTIIYIVLAVLSPDYVLPALAPYHLQVGIAVLAICASVPIALQKNILMAPQSVFLAVIIAGMVPSFVVMGWYGGAVQALDKFIPSAAVFYLVLVNCRKIRRLRTVALAACLIAVYLVIMGAIAYGTRDPNSPWLFTEKLDSGVFLMRMRAFGFLNDPNDLAQYLLTITPFLWLMWRDRRTVRNFLLVIVPAGIILVGVFLTHSRGGLVGFAALLVFAFKDRLGPVKSSILAALGFAGLMVLNITGGRSVSMQGGADRLELWSYALESFRSSPLFGVGFQQFSETHRNAVHNTFLNCAVELGLFGYLFWMGLLVFSFSDLGAVLELERGRATAVAAGAGDQGGSLTAHATDGEEDSRAMVPQLQRFAYLVRIAFVGYLATGFFLSRTYTLSLFVLLGMAAAVRRTAADAGLLPPTTVTLRLMRRTAFLAVASLGVIYAIVRLHWMR